MSKIKRRWTVRSGTMTEQPVLAQYSLQTTIDRLSPRTDESGRRAEILVKHDQLRVTLVTMRAGIELAEHSARAPLTFHVLQGRFTFEYTGGSAELGPGDILALRENVDHRVLAHEEGAFLLTLGWSTD
jgi:quercetin dioxygenase-like cupin family protein